MIAFFLLACGPGEPTPMLTGTITPSGHELSADFYGYKAFAFDNAGTFVAYIASHKEATCEGVAQYFGLGDLDGEIVIAMYDEKGRVGSINMTNRRCSLVGIKDRVARRPIGDSFAREALQH